MKNLLINIGKILENMSNIIIKFNSELINIKKKSKCRTKF